MMVISNQDEENNRRSSMGISSLVPIQYAQSAGKFLSRKVSGILVLDTGDVASNAAFVLFNSIQAAQTTEQFLQSKEPFKFTVSAAPAVDDVLWKVCQCMHLLLMLHLFI
jgi:hypothetical protein